MTQEQQLWTNRQLRRRADDIALGHAVTGPLLSRVYDAMLVMSAEAQAAIAAANQRAEAAEALVNELQDALDGMRGIAKGRQADAEAAEAERDAHEFQSNLRAARIAELEQQLEQSRAWEPVKEYTHTEHLNMGPGKPSRWQRVEVRGRMITIDRDDTGTHAALLPPGMGVFRRTTKGADDGS